MKKIISFLVLLVTVVLVAGLNPNSANAKTLEYTYTFDNIPDQTIKYDWIDNYNNFLELTINGTTYNVNSEYQVRNAYCDRLGTVWASLSNDSRQYYLGFYNFELQGSEDINFHILRSGIVIDCDDNRFVSYANDDSPHMYWTLPTIEELSNYLLTGKITLNYIPGPNSIPTSTPVPATSTPKIDVTTAPTTETPVQPVSTPEVKPSTIPSTQPSSVPVVQPISTPTIQTDVTPVIEKRQLKSKIQLTYILGNNSKVITLSKSGILKYKKSAIKKIKDATFTETGDIIYLKKNGDAYYVSNSKIKFLRHKVKSIKKKNNFAISLKLKNGKTVKLKI